MKKLLFYNPSFETGGVEKNLLSFLKYNVFLKDYKFILFTLDKVKRNNIKTYPKKKYSIKTRIIKYFLSFFYLIFYCLKNDCVIFSLQNNIVAIIVSILTNKKIIIRLNTSPDKYSNSYFKKIFFSLFYNFSDIILVNDEDFRKKVKEYFKLDSKIIHNCIDIDKIIKDSRKKIDLKFFSDKNYLNIISVGRLTDQKDHITLLKAIKILKNKKVKVIIMGSGINLIYLNNFIKKNNLKNIVKIISYKKNPHKYIKAANLFVLTSKYEGSPNILLEVAAQKKLIISSNCPTGPRKILQNGKGGYLFNVGNYKKLAKIISKINIKSKINRNKANATFNNLRHFNKKNQLKEFLELFKSSAALKN